MKKNFVLRTDAATYEALEKWAADEFRSVNGQLEWIIRKALKDAKRLPQKKVGQGSESEGPDKED
ncbi:MAG: Arc family DNA binding domain-containing protein [Lewinellaceae bacterium]|nr:Arc family DNA binding domain-containing protein [Lewinellaceae bacterium]